MAGVIADTPAKTIPLLEESLQRQPSLLEVVPLTQSIALAVRQVPREQVPDLPDRVIAATCYLPVSEAQEG